MPEIDFAEIRRRVPLPQFVESCGIDLQPEGDGWRAPCLLHQEEHGASFLLYPDQRWYCHGKCARGGDIIDLACALWDCDTLTAIDKLLSGDEIPVLDSEQPAETAPSRGPREPKWPGRDLETIDRIVRDGPGLYDLWERSPLRFDDEANHAEEIIDTILPGDPYLCLGKTNEVFATRRRSVWRGRISDLPLIVPNPMLSANGRTKKNTLSEHSLEATADRVYLVIEFDFDRYERKCDGTPKRDERGNEIETQFAPLIKGWQRDQITIADACASLHWHLATIPAALPLVLAVHSGGKSLHAWFRAYPLYDEATWPFMHYAYQLGADHVTWTRSQFVRVPDGTRQDGRPQKTYYLNPQEAVIDEQS